MNTFWGWLHPLGRTYLGILGRFAMGFKKKQTHLHHNFASKSSLASLKTLLSDRAPSFPLFNCSRTKLRSGSILCAFFFNTSVSSTPERWSVHSVTTCHLQPKRKTHGFFHGFLIPNGKPNGCASQGYDFRECEKGPVPVETFSHLLNLYLLTLVEIIGILPYKINSCCDSLFLPLSYIHHLMFLQFSTLNVLYMYLLQPLRESKSL